MQITSTFYDSMVDNIRDCSLAAKLSRIDSIPGIEMTATTMLDSFAFSISFLIDPSRFCVVNTCM